MRYQTPQYILDYQQAFLQKFNYNFWSKEKGNTMCENQSKKYKVILNLTEWAERNSITLTSLYNQVFKWNGLQTTLKDLENAGWVAYVVENKYSANEYIYFYQHTLRKLMRITGDSWHITGGTNHARGYIQLDYIQDSKFDKYSTGRNKIQPTIKAKEETIPELLKKLKELMIQSEDYAPPIEEEPPSAEILNFMEKQYA